MSFEDIKEDVEKGSEKELELSKRKIVPVNEIRSMTEKENPFLLEGMIAENAINTITSDSGKGKSLLMLKMMESIVRGDKFLDKYKTKKTKVLIIDLEMSENDLIQRTKSVIDEDIDGLDFYYCDTINIQDKQEFEWLVDLIKEKQYGLIVFDTLSGIHGEDEIGNAEMNKVNKLFLELTNKHNITVLHLHHHRKLSKGEKISQSSSRGASSIIDKVASQLLIDNNNIIVNRADKFPLDGIKMTVEQFKNRQLGGLKRFAIEIYYDPEIKRTIFRWAGLEEKKESSLQKAKTIIISLMDKGEEYTLSEFKESVKEVGERNLREALKELVEKDHLITFRFPADGENQLNFKPLRKNSKIYTLKTE